MCARRINARRAIANRLAVAVEGAEIMREQPPRSRTRELVKMCHAESIAREATSQILAEPAIPNLKVWCGPSGASGLRRPDKKIGTDCQCRFSKSVGDFGGLEAQVLQKRLVTLFHKILS